MPLDAWCANTFSLDCCDCDDNIDLCKDCVKRGCPDGPFDHVFHIISRDSNRYNVLWSPGEPGVGKTVTT
jgi:hypothetical protein